MATGRCITFTGFIDPPRRQRRCAKAQCGRSRLRRCRRASSTRAGCGASRRRRKKLHRIYHRSLIGNCGSQSLIAFCGQLADRLYGYRRLSIRKAFPSRAVGDEHAAIVETVLSGDVEQAVQLLIAHYQRTADVILQDETIFPELRRATEAEG
jgi:DNA-binding GntR family transcriptional regulator